MIEIQDILLVTAIAHDIERFFEVNFGSSEEGLRPEELLWLSVQYTACNADSSVGYI